MVASTKSARQQVGDGLKNNQRIIESHDTGILTRAWELIDEGVIALSVCAPPITADNNEKDHILMMMLVNCLSDVIAAYESALQGFIRPPAIILRCAVENLAAVVTFHSNDEHFQKFKNGKYYLPDAITPSKEFFGALAIHYGVLTNKFVHEQYETVGRALGKEKVFEVVPRLAEGVFPDHGTLLMSIVGLVAFDIAQITEWAFIRFFKTPRFWVRLGDGEIKSKSDGPIETVRFFTKELEAWLAKSPKESGEG